MTLSEYVASIDSTLAQPGRAPEDLLDIIERALYTLDHRFSGDVSGARVHFLQLKAPLASLVDYDVDAEYEALEDEQYCHALNHDAALSRSLAHL